MQKRKTVLAINGLLSTGVLLLSTLPLPLAAAEEETREETVDTISVTASRVARGTKEVPGAIDVIDKEKIEAAKMVNIKDAIQGTPGVLIDSKNGGYDVRLIIRGAGVKANYGVREIMVLRDGVPMTDPDSFSRFDFIDTQDIERIEITKGPGSLFGSGSAGGTVQIISKSVFDNDEQRLRAGLGQYGGQNLHARIGGDINDSNAFSLTASHRALENGWRDWNEFDTQQVSFKHGLMLEDGATLESELSYSQADMQLPGSMTKEEFDRFKQTGEQKDTSSPWQNSGRYSTIWFFNSRLEKEFGNLTFKPRVYLNRWDHYHPVTGAINDNPGTSVFGTDLEFAYRHQLLGESTLVAGITGRVEDTDESFKYKYLDIQNGLPQTTSDRAGDLMEVETATNTLYGLFMQETLNPSERMSIDIGFRYDRNQFDIDTTAYSEYSYRTGRYSDFATPEQTHTDSTFRFFSPKLGVTYALTDAINVYGSIAQSGQVPSGSEIQSNPNLDAAEARNIELGLKGRSHDWSFDLAFYRTEVSDEIVSILNGYVTEFQNAGKTLKKGFEISSRYNLTPNWWVGANYAYSNYTFEEFQEIVYGRTGATLVDRAGNHLPYVPRHQYSLSLGFEHPSGWKARVQSDTWGEYWMDNANSEKHGGYDFLTSLMIGYEQGPHSLALNVDNLFDQHYAVEAKKSGSTYSYSAGSPRNAMLTYTYTF